MHASTLSGKTGFLTLAFCLLAALVQAQNISMTISNIKSRDGQILVAVFTNQQNFKDEKAAFKHQFSKTSVSNGILKVNFDLPAGTYGIALIDDQNKNGKLDKNFVGIPKEGVGFSNFYLSGVSKPDFDDFKFDVKTSAVAVECKLRNF
ncbi:DUF2141 domain-containing protein [Dyadobacter sandarakinus]|uniref:DUF2141 domain-containing protein n=1 Tax=Dyadobacter sandarakinus TaxID=2747268 RepID=A0ABX7IAF4_9BACT|nr:DUF2141 domain-containing protein [Dyadobacter sandarakinus]QRR02427.1 DUF2141 domain-containing protein [Dyadobacter sandarakinus]